LLNKQKVVLHKVIEAFATKGTGILLNLHTGFGKTILALYIISIIGEKALILCSRREIKAQWEDKINMFCTDDIKSKIDVYCEMTFSKLEFESNKYITVVIDECHMMMDLVFGKILPKLTPQFLIGLSATPKCQDLLRLFFHKTLIVPPKKNITAIKINLEFEPKIRFMWRGGEKKIDYQYMIGSLADNEERTKIMADHIYQYLIENPNLVGMVLLKRVSNVKIIASHLENKGMTVVKGFGVAPVLRDKPANVLVGTYSKIGVGFDDSRYSMIFICDNVKDVRQAEGRIRSKCSIIVDFVDNHPIFERHWENRQEWYQTVDPKLEARNVL
jgi:superfamily II DNA or RNA helicase